MNNEGPISCRKQHGHTKQLWYLRQVAYQSALFQSRTHYKCFVGVHSLLSHFLVEVYAACSIEDQHAGDLNSRALALTQLAGRHPKAMLPRITFRGITNRAYEADTPDEDNEFMHLERTFPAMLLKFGFESSPK